MAVLLLGSWIRMRSVQQTPNTVNRLSKLLPETAERITDDGSTEVVSVGELSKGDLVLVRPGTSIPADGIIKKGDSKIDESMIAGGSKPTQKNSGDKVFAGTVNGNRSLCVRIIATGDETRFAEIIRLVEKAWKIPC